MRADITMKRATLQERNLTSTKRSHKVFVDGSNKFGQRSKVIITLFSCIDSLEKLIQKSFFCEGVFVENSIFDKLCSPSTQLSRVDSASDLIPPN